MQLVSELMLELVLAEPAVVLPVVAWVLMPERVVAPVVLLVVVLVVLLVVLVVVVLVVLLVVLLAELVAELLAELAAELVAELVLAHPVEQRRPQGLIRPTRLRPH